MRFQFIDEHTVGLCSQLGCDNWAKPENKVYVPLQIDPKADEVLISLGFPPITGIYEHRCDEHKEGG